MSKHRILVAGGGPAGAAAALGLNALGYDVCVVSAPRPFAALEGVSERVISAMRAAGFRSALQHIAPPSARTVTWNGNTSAANTEALIDRQKFDAALLDDLQAQGVRVLRERISALSEQADGWLLSTASGQLIRGDFLLEARGRAAPAAGTARLRSAETLALLQYWQAQPGAAWSAVQSLPMGWVWLAQRADGRRYLQLTLDAATALPDKASLPAWCRARVAHLPRLQAFMQGAETADFYARTSTQILCQDLSAERWLRIGDAAMAVDPMSGNGIFQALSSALQAPAVVHTILAKPQQAALAQDFYRQRVEGLFFRFARTGRDFCRLEQQWPQQPFWAGRCHWPDDEPLHQSVTPDAVYTAMRPVVDDGFIRAAQVVVTPDQPLGIWHVNGIELAPALGLLQQPQGALQLAEKLGKEKTQRLINWLTQQGLLASV